MLETVALPVRSIFFFISWRLITLQYYSGFCHTLTRISHGFTCIPQKYFVYDLKVVLATGCNT